MSSLIEGYFVAAAVAVVGVGSRSINSELKRRDMCTWVTDGSGGVVVKEKSQFFGSACVTQ